MEPLDILIDRDALQQRVVELAGEIAAALESPDVVLVGPLKGAVVFMADLARALHDEDLDVDTDFCAMCGHDWCSVRISREIQEIASGKDEAYAWESPKISSALTEEQRSILEQRGVLDPEEIHRLASKTKQNMKGKSGSKASCHSDAVDGGQAKNLQAQSGLVELNTAPAHNISKHDPII